MSLLDREPNGAVEHLDWMTWRTGTPSATEESIRGTRRPPPPPLAPPAPVPTGPDAALDRIRLAAAVSLVVVVGMLVSVAVWQWNESSSSSDSGTQVAAASDSTAGEPAAIGAVGVCAVSPVFAPSTSVNTPEGLVLRTFASTPCTGGGILSSSATKIVVMSGSRLVASASFDFSTTPVSLSGAEGRSVDLVFPPGSYFELSVPTIDPGGLTIRAEEAGTRSVTELSGSAAPDGVRAVATSAYSPPDVDVESVAADALTRRVVTDRDVVGARAEGRWVAQLSSKRAGLVAEGRTWDDVAILAEFSALAQRFGEVRLLRSDEWSVFSSPGLLVTITDQIFGDAGTAVSWCRSQGFDRDHCFAKKISRSSPPYGTTVYID